MDHSQLFPYGPSPAASRTASRGCDRLTLEDVAQALVDVGWAERYEQARAERRQVSHEMSREAGN